LSVHLKRSQILSITSLIQVLLLSPWPCRFMLDNNDCNSSNFSTSLLTVLTKSFSLLWTHLACADDLLQLSRNA
jgi:hypothetical protein